VRRREEGERDNGGGREEAGKMRERERCHVHL
jgi:hypothetical protein